MNMRGKQVIAELVSGLVQEDEHIIVDPSTTAVAIVKALKNRKRLTVITNSIEILVELSDVSGWDIISTGGTLRESYLALVGAEGELTESVPLMRRRLILSCKGIDLKKGITVPMKCFPR